MADTSWDEIDQARVPKLGDYYELLKPRVMRLVVFTAFVGMFIAPGTLHPFIGFVALLCIALGAGASGALNMYIDADIDAVMKRTMERPIPSGRVTRDHALALGLFSSVLSVSMLGIFTNWFAAGLLAFTIFFYVVIYSMGLKRRTTQNIVIGGAAGAFPPMVGWAAVTGDIAWGGVLLFLVIFLWTPPHFWALALFRNADYQAAKVPMMPVIKGEARTRLEIFVYSLLLAAISLVTAFSSIGGWVTGFVAVLGGSMMVLGAWQLWRGKPSEAHRNEKRYFAFSIIFLTAFFMAVLIDHLMKILGA